MTVTMDGYEISEQISNTPLSIDEVVMILDSVILIDMDWEKTTNAIVQAIVNNYDGEELQILKSKINQL